MVEKKPKSKLLKAGKINKLVINWYYDLHGDIINQDPEKKEFKEEKAFSIFETKTKYGDDWEVMIMGEDSVKWIDAYKYDQKTKTLTVRACSGAG